MAFRVALLLLTTIVQSLRNFEGELDFGTETDDEGESMALELGTDVQEAPSFLSRAEQEVATMQQHWYPTVFGVIAEVEKRTHNKYTVRFVGELGERGANGAVTVLYFEPHAKSSRPPEKDHANSSRPPEKDFEGFVAHKASKEGTYSKSEPHVTKLMSESCGFSVGYVSHMSFKGHVHMFTEFTRSISLKTASNTRLSNRIRLPENVQQFFLVQMVIILLRLQEQHVVHRDIKPDNAIIPEACEKHFEKGETDLKKWGGDNCFITFIDYGLACLKTGESDGMVPCSRGGGFVGTVGYAPPARSSGGVWTFNDDVYSMGAFAVRLFTGTWPPRVKLMGLLDQNEHVQNTTVAEYQQSDAMQHEVARLFSEYSVSPWAQGIIRRMLDSDGGVIQAVMHATSKEHGGNGLLESTHRHAGRIQKARADRAAIVLP